MKTKMNQELDAILNDPKEKIVLDTTKVLKALEELREITKSATQSLLNTEPKMSQRYYQSSILKLDISARDKVILMDMLLNGSSVKGTEAQLRCNMSKAEYNNGARSLVKQFYTVKDKCGHYSINSKIF